MDALDFYDLDQVPKASRLDDIWFYMNVRLNFSRLFRETRPIKLRQQLKWLKYVATKTAPDNAIILYFYAYLQHRVLGEIEQVLVERLKSRLDIRLLEGALQTFWPFRRRRYPARISVMVIVG